MKTYLLTLTSVLMAQGLFLFAQTADQVCIPQFVNGTLGPFRWRTTLVIQNQDQAQAQVRMHFYGSDGQPMNGLMLNERAGQGQQVMVGADGKYNAEPMAGQATRSFRSSGTGPFQAGYCVVESENRVQAHSMLQLFDSEGNLISETGIIPSPQFRFGSFFSDQTDSRGVGLALMNSDANQGSVCTIALYQEEGDILLDTVEFAIEPQSQVARFLTEMFPGLLTDDVGYVRVSCENPVCALALQLRGLEMLQIPVFVQE